MSQQQDKQGSCFATGGPESDRVGVLNNSFRELYGLNRDHVVAETPLIGLTLIGTGEIFRYEYGQLVKCYHPVSILPKIKGLMHSVLGAHGTWRLLMRDQEKSSAQDTAAILHKSLEVALSRLPEELPEELIIPARAVFVELLKLSEKWNTEASSTPDEFPAALARVQPFLQEVITFTGKVAYRSLVKSFEAFVSDSDQKDLRNSFVGVCGPGQGRRDNIEIAAAMTVMGEEAAGIRLLYLENALTIPDGLKSLASIIVERDLGQAVFNDPYRMWRDLLADEARQHVGGSFFIQLGPAAE